MSKAPSNFRQLDVTRAIKGAQAAGKNVARVEIDPKTSIMTLHCDGQAPLPVVIEEVKKKRRRKYRAESDRLEQAK